MTASPEPDLTALREEIRRTGASLRVGRCALLGGLLLVPIWMALNDCVFLREEPGISWSIVLFLLAACSLVAWVGPPLVAGARRFRRRRLRARLSRLAPAERAEVLLPVMKAGDSETRRLVLPLLREFGI